MLQNFDMTRLEEIRKRDPDAANLIDSLLEHHRITLTTISHEIRNPLSLVYSKLELMELKYPELRAMKHWASLVEDVTYMKHLLEELSTYNNGSQLNISHMDSTMFFRKLILSFAISIEESEVEFISDIPDNLPDYYGDAYKLKEVFMNLLRNAFEALYDSHSSTKRKKELRFLVNHDAEKRALLITIADSGCGIAPENLPTIFDMFQTYKPGGTGLGLALSKRIVEAHGGSISVESKLHKGSAFHISLPLSSQSALEQ